LGVERRTLNAKRASIATGQSLTDAQILSMDWLAEGVRASGDSG